jgi:hypothetical protein
MALVRSVALYSSLLLIVLFVSITSWISHSHQTSWIPLLAWSVSQWIFIPSLSKSLQQFAWDRSELEYDVKQPAQILEIPTVNVQEQEDVLQYLETTYGANWRDHPVLFKGLWNELDLKSDNRRLSLEGLMKEELEIPYFTDASQVGALSPDAQAPVHQIIANISQGAPHKIGTQFLVQTYPELIEEVAPVPLLTQLFGRYFEPQYLFGTGQRMFPGPLTVPVFVANGNSRPNSPQQCIGSDEGDDETCTASTDESSLKRPLTGLHCEPIGNVAVQLLGAKQWTLVDPKYSFRLVPSIAPDGRAFYASWAPTLDHVPRYSTITHAGDAIWVPTWTWHRVDYIEQSQDISIGGSLFHFRPVDFLRRNPLYALLMIPALVKELAGVSTQ